jgi:transcriptional regulator with XRE-family HTH domain
MIGSRQIAAARGLLGLSQEKLAAAAGISRATLSNIESGSDTRASNLQAIEAVLVKRGVAFTKSGVDLRQKMEPVNWDNGRPADPVIRRRVIEGLNMARAARGNALLFDPEDE